MGKRDGEESRGKELGGRRSVWGKKEKKYGWEEGEEKKGV